MIKSKKILTFEIINTLLIIVLGFIFHFVYEWSNNNILLGIFSPINESIWEHLKLLFFPTLLTIIIEQIYFRKINDNYLCIKTKGLILSLFFIIVFHYTYSGILGRNIAFIDISSFLIATLIVEYYTYNKLKSNQYCNNTSAIIILSIITLLFIIFTFSPPHIGIFKDPITGLFGVFKKSI